MATTSNTTTTVSGQQATGRRRGRGIGGVGAAARLLLGAVLLGSVLQGELAGPFRPAAWALGLAGLPAVLVVWQWWRARRGRPRLQATGPVGHTLNLAAFLALYLTPTYAPALRFTSDAALLFYGASMLLAALRGYGGCEVLAVSNWLLGRDDQVGCVVFAPIDHLERHRRR